MPQAVPFFEAAAAWLTGPTFAAQFARLALQALVMQALVKRPGAGPLPLNVSVRSTIAARQIVFGQVRASGAFIYYRCSGTKNKYLWYVIAYAGHQTEAALDGYLDKFKVPAADINNTTGDVATVELDGKLKWWTHRGTQAQTVDAQLDAEFASWTSDHRLRGISYDVLRMERSDKAFPQGAPQSVTRVLKGVKCYDPRLDSTNGGSGSHRMNDPQTWAWTDNFALCVLWYLTGGSVVNDQASRLVRYGPKESYDRIDWPFWVAAANKSDQSVSGANAPPSGAQTRYTLNLEVICDLTRRDIIELMLPAGGPAQLIYVHGKWRLYVAGYDAPSHAFTQDDLHGDMEIDDTTGEEERFNSLSARYVDAAKDYTEQTSLPRTSSAYVTQDNGEELPEETDLQAVNNEYRAQRICELMLRTARQMRTVKFVFGRQGLKVAPWEPFTIDHSKYGWTGRVFRCLEREVERDDDGAMRCIITARAEASSVYDDPLTADYTTGTSVTNSLQSEPPDEPTGLTATALQRAIEFNWSVGAFWERNGIVELWEAPVGTAFGSATRIWIGQGTRAVIQKADSVPRAYWVRIVTIGGQASSTEPASTGYTASALRDQEIIADPNFDWSADQTYWQFNNDLFTTGTPTGIALVGSGGVSAGYLQLTGDSTAKYAFNKRSENFAVVTGQQIKVRFRWMRTGSLTSANGTDPVFGLASFTHVGGIPVTGAFESCGTLSFTRNDVNAVNVNEWQESEVTLTIVNKVKSSTQLPYLLIAIGMQSACTGGVIRVEHVEAHLV